MHAGSWQVQRVNAQCRLLSILYTLNLGCWYLLSSSPHRINDRDSNFHRSTPHHTQAHEAQVSNSIKTQKEHARPSSSTQSTPQPHGHACASQRAAMASQRAKHAKIAVAGGYHLNAESGPHGCRYKLHSYIYGSCTCIADRTHSTFTITWLPCGGCHSPRRSAHAALSVPPRWLLTTRSIVSTASMAQSSSTMASNLPASCMQSAPPACNQPPLHAINPPAQWPARGRASCSSRC